MLFLSDAVAQPPEWRLHDFAKTSLTFSLCTTAVGVRGASILGSRLLSRHAGNRRNDRYRPGVEMSSSLLPLSPTRRLRATRCRGVIGAALGLTAVAAFPGLLAVGPVLMALEGLTAVAAGAGGGAFVGASSGLGWWHVEADVPDRAIEEGAILVGVSVPNGRCEEATAVLQHAGADRVDSI